MPRHSQNIYAGDAGLFKVCSKCDSAKLLFCFNAKVRNEDGKKEYCRDCHNKQQKKYAEDNPELVNAKNRRWRENNPEKAKACSNRNAAERLQNGKYAIYYEKNRSHIKSVSAEWWKANPHKRKEYSDKYYLSAKAKVSAAIRVGIRTEIKFGSKGSRKTFDLLGYSVFDLMIHLETMFIPGMSWNNYGRGGWHIDHIIPLASFNYETPDDPDFKKAWALSNLQPLWQFDNLSKGCRMISEPKVAA